MQHERAINEIKGRNRNTKEEVYYYGKWHAYLLKRQ